MSKPTTAETLEAIKRFQRSRGLTDREVDRAIKVKPGSVSRWKSGETVPMS